LPVGRVHFGRQETSEPQSPQPLSQDASPRPAQEYKPDPKPRYLNRRLFQSWALVLGGVTGGLALPTAAGNFHAWSQQRAQQAVVAPAEAVGGQILDQVARSNTQIRSLPVAPTAMDYYTRFLAWDALFLAWSFRLGLFRRNLRSQDLWKELNEKGIRGKGMTIGVVDSGVLPTRTLSADRIKRMTSAGKALPLKDRVGHGTAIASLMAGGSPESQVLVVDPFSYEPEQMRDFMKASQNFFSKGFSDPESMTMSSLRQLSRADIAGVAQSVITAVDQGANVVSVSLNLEKALLAEMRSQIRLTEYTKKVYRWLSPTRWLNPKAHQAQLERYDAYTDKLAQLLAERTISATLDDEIRGLYAPWRAALDYAAARGIPVFVSSGNAGPHFSPRSDALGQSNLLAIEEHPALMVIASADHQGQVSPFSSEMNDRVTPLGAGNGSGELDTQPSFQRGWLSRIYTPMWAFGKRASYLHNQGTSFSAPDVAVLYLKMKEIDPALTLEEAKAIIARTAGPARLSPKEEKETLEGLQGLISLEAQTEAFKQAAQHPSFWPTMGKHLAKVLPDQAALKDFVERMLARPNQLTEAETKILNVAYLQVSKTLLDPESPALQEQARQSVLQNHLKRRVGAGVVRRYAAIEETEAQKAKRKQAPEKT